MVWNRGNGREVEGDVCGESGIPRTRPMQIWIRGGRGRQPPVHTLPDHTCQRNDTHPKPLLTILLLLFRIGFGIVWAGIYNRS